jgi:hypothetical protein
MMEIIKIRTYCFEFKHKRHEDHCFWRFTIMKIREGFLGIFIGGTFEKIAGEVLGVD